MLAKGHRPQVAGLRRAHAARQVDQARAATQVSAVEHGRSAAAGQRHEVGVGHVLVAVGVSQAFGLGHQVHAKGGGLAAVVVQRCGLVQREVETLQDAQCLSHRQAAAAGRRHAAHPHVAVGAANGHALDRPVSGQVRQSRHAGCDAARGVGYFIDDVLRQRAAVEGSSAAIGNRRKSGGQSRARQQRAGGLGAVVGVEEIGASL